MIHGILECHQGLFAGRGTGDGVGMGCANIPCLWDIVLARPGRCSVGPGCSALICLLSEMKTHCLF